MERPIFQPVGTPVEELDTPALVIDLDVMDRNIQTFQGYFAATAAKARPVVTSHLCPQIARRQLVTTGLAFRSLQKKWPPRQPLKLLHRQ